MDSTDYQAAHRDAFVRLDGLLRSVDGQTLATTVPACPRWDVLDVARHLTGLAVDCSGETLPGPEDWEEETMDRRHVDARRHMDLDDVLDEWCRAAPGFEQTLGTIDRRMAGAIVGEYACHEHDVRGAIGRPGARDSLCTTVAMDTYVSSLLGRVRSAELPTLEIVAGATRWGPDAGAAENQVHADPYEIFRAVTGRRTADQIRSLGWRGDPAPYVPVFSSFGLPDRPLDD